MPKTTYLGRKAVSLENDALRVTVTEEGGHIAEVFSKAAGVNPLWVPNWTTGEPSNFGPEQERIFGTGVESKLLYGILGHNLCVDLFGGPSATEFAAGITVHGEASILPYEVEERDGSLVCSLHMPLAQLRVTRTLTLRGSDVLIHENVENLAAFDRPLAWTQHVTLSPPFLDPKTTEFRMTGDLAMTIESEMSAPAYLALGKTFEWPHAPLANGGSIDLHKMKPDAPASSFVALRMTPGGENASWTAWSPQYKLAISYVWRREDFPWLGIWEENCARNFSPWDSAAVTRGMEFGTSPFAESRRQMVERGKLFDTPAYKWLPALKSLEATYWIRTTVADAIPETVQMPSA
jgi:hypothetical protein